MSRVRLDPFGLLIAFRNVRTLPEILEEKLSAILSQKVGELLPANVNVSVTAAADLRFGDYQSNVAMVLAKALKKNPRALAQELQESFANDDSVDVEIAGPGFLNFRVKPNAYAARMQEIAQDERLGVPQLPERKVVIDFSAPNVAKPMHVGHIRSTIIGDTLGRIARFLGYKVITDNHIGDWGTQFGMILWGWKNLLDQAELEKNPIDALLNLYKEVNLKCKADPEILDACKRELVALQAGDEQNLAIWQKCVAVSKSGLEKIYDQLDIKFDYWLGESFYNDALGPLVEELLASGLACEDQGAICVFSDHSLSPQEDPFLVQDKGEWRGNPAIIRKADGGFLYATTDLATIDYRIKTWNADDIWYVVGAPQALHFRQIFDITRRRGQTASMKHIAFGSILGEDRKPFKTRSGETVSLQDVLDEAVERAKAAISEKNPEIQGEEREKTARIVGIGAVKFAELSQHRMTDYVFNWDKLLALQGDTAPYLQYSCVRVRSIFRKAQEMGIEVGNGKIILAAEQEIHLARMLTRYGEMVPQVLTDFRPNILATYLLELARAFHSFFEACPVLKSEGEIRQSRLALANLTDRVLTHGMSLLGMEVPERM